MALGVGGLLTPSSVNCTRPLRAVIKLAFSKGSRSRVQAMNIHVVCL